MQYLKTSVGLALVVVLAAPSAVLAGGGYLTPPEHIMYEPAQQAFIDHDAGADIEQLTILPGFRGDAREFVWLVPVPALPEVAVADRELFQELDALTRPIYRHRDGQWDCFSNRSHDIAFDGDPEPVDIINRQLVGYYQTVTLSATEAPALLDSLTVWGFLHDGNREVATAAITDYVARAWFFVAVRIDSTAMAEVFPYFQGEVWGGLDPLQLTFASDEIIYPMKISAVSATAVSSVILYVKTDHRLTFAGANTPYANRFTAEEISQLNLMPAVQAPLRPGDFVTRLDREYRRDEMTEDLVLRRADNDDEFLAVNYSGFPWTGLVLLVPPLGMAVRRRFWVRG